MNANKWVVAAGVCICVVSSGAMAVQGLDASGNSKVNNSLAKKWSNTDTSRDGYKAQQDKRVVNVGSRR